MSNRTVVELYDALAGLLSAAEADPDNHDPHSDIYTAIVTARTALAKAEDEAAMRKMEA